MVTTPIVLQPRWRFINDDPPKDGRWIWGEWPAIQNGLGIAARLVVPMRWGKIEGFKPHWLRFGCYTPGDGPKRWAPMIYPVGDEPEPSGQDNALTREGIKHALMRLDLPLAEDNGIVDYE